MRERADDWVEECLGMTAASGARDAEGGERRPDRGGTDRLQVDGWRMTERMQANTHPPQHHGRYT